MIKNIKINYKFDKGEPRVYFKKLNLNPDINILYGGNGIGKSSLLKILESKLKNAKNYNKQIIVDKDTKNKMYIYKNSRDNIKESKLFDGMPEQFVMYFKSEGEGIYLSLHHFIGALEDAIKNDECDINIVFIDELDSGLSCELQSRLFKRIKKLANKGIQFIITVNTYQLIRDNKGECVNMLNGEHIKLNSYDEFFELAKENRKVIGTKFM